MNLIVYSHSDYYYLWGIIEECILKIPELNPIFICNKTEHTKPNGFIKYIEYDETFNYSHRWTINILPHINEQHILVVHDVQIIVNCNIDFIYKIIKTMVINDIDRCSLNVFDGQNIIQNDNIKLCELNSSKGLTFTPYDVCPAIWKTNSLKKLYETFPLETYHSTELNIYLQTFCEKNFKCYGIQKTHEKIQYCLGRPYSIHFQILFITIKGSIMFPTTVYMDMENDFMYYFKKYNLKDKIKINNNYVFILQNFKAL